MGFGGAAVLSICCSFLGKLAALINTIPGPVIGGISFLLYGMIGTSGLRMLVDNQVDYSKSRNLALTSVVFIVGLSGIALNLGNVKLTGMVLACVVAMALSLIFYILDKLHMNGIVGRHGKKMCLNSLYYMFKNVRYKGTYVWNEYTYQVMRKYIGSKPNPRIVKLENGQLKVVEEKNISLLSLN